MSSMNYHGGLAAEDLVSAHYARNGAQIRATRARTPAGEIDLIMQDGGTILFVEVKARRTATAAVASLSRRQIERITMAAQIWLDENGHNALTPCRFDLALVDATGAIEIIENAFGEGI